MFDPHRPDVVFRALLFRLCIERPPAAAPLKAGQNHLPDRGREILLHRRLLGQIADLIWPEPIARQDLPGKRLLQAEDRPHERAFAGAVLPDDAEIVSAVYFKRQVVEDLPTVIA